MSYEFGSCTEVATDLDDRQSVSSKYYIFDKEGRKIPVNIRPKFNKESQVDTNDSESEKAYSIYFPEDSFVNDSLIDARGQIGLIE